MILFKMLIGNVLCTILLCFWLFTACRPLAEKEKTDDGIPIDCTYSLPNLAQINRFILESPEDGRLFRIRSQILIDSGQYAEALSDAKRALSLNPDDLYNFVVVGKAHRALGHVDSALSACATAEKMGFKDPDNYLLLGDLYFIVRKYNISLDYLNKALKLAPYEPRIYFLKGLLFWEQHDTTKAVSNWQTAIEQDAGFGDGYAKLATYYMNQKEYNTAEQYLRSGLRLRPNDPILHYDMGVFLTYKGYADSAANCYQTALRLKPDLAQAQANLGLILFNQRKYTEAAQLLEQAQPSDPKNARIAYALGMSGMYTGQWTKANQWLTTVVRLDKDYVKDATSALEKVRKMAATAKADSLENK